MISMKSCFYNFKLNQIYIALFKNISYNKDREAYISATPKYFVLIMRDTVAAVFFLFHNYFA